MAFHFFKATKESNRLFAFFKRSCRQDACAPGINNQVSFNPIELSATFKFQKETHEPQSKHRSAATDRTDATTRRAGTAADAAARPGATRTFTVATRHEPLANRSRA
jgi:hypothetical protein